jgi:hypothetical protein
VVNLFAMADAKHQNPDFIVVDAADNAVIPNPVAP